MTSNDQSASAVRRIDSANLGYMPPASHGRDTLRQRGGGLVLRFIMDMRTVRVSDTVTRYFVNANLGPHSRVLLVRPGDGTIITGWCSGANPRSIDGEWVSPFDDLVMIVRGDDLDEVQRQAPLTLAS